MKFYKKSSSSGVPFARKIPYEYQGTKFEPDLKDGDVVRVMDAGEKEMGQFGERTNFKIKTRNGEKRVSFNASTIGVLAEEIGEESNDWVGKSVKVLLRKAVINGKKVIIPYFVTEGYILDEYGELTREEDSDRNENGTKKPAKKKAEDDGLDQYPVEELGDSPF